MSHRLPQQIISEIENLPTGDYKEDHAEIENLMIETLKLCHEIIGGEWGFEDENADLVQALIEKWKDIHNWEVAL